MLKTYFVLVFIVFCFSCACQELISGRNGGFGGGFGVSGDLSNVLNNPSAMFLTDNFVGINYRSGFLLGELSERALVSKVSVGSNSFGCLFDVFGFRNYYEYRSCFGYGKRMGEGFYGGVNMSYVGVNQSDGYGDFGLLSGSVGFFVEVNNKISLGGALLNVVKSDYSKNYMQNRGSINCGIKYSHSGSFAFYGEVSKKVASGGELKVGGEYDFKDRYFVRFGMVYPDVRSCFGFGFVYNNIRIDVSSSVHRYLGSGFVTSIVYEFGSNRDR